MTYTTRNGQRLHVNVAAAFDRMAAAFKAAFGLLLIVVSGTRTNAEQEAIFRARYVLAGQVNGRRVYDTRWWNGAVWYRISAAGTVAPPGSSNHQESGPNGPRSIDIRDSGADAGVTVAGSVRDRWMLEHAGEFGFENEGNKFGERWHKTFRGSLAEGSTGGGSGGGSSSLPGPEVMLSWRWIGIQEMLRGTGRYRGAIDNIPGPGTISGFQDFIRDFGYRNIVIDGRWGPETCKGAQSWLRAKWGYSGAIDAIPGDGTHAAWNRAESANAAAF